ncbi:hypothetical protein SD81_013925 [Tolypothrix campylonemoides VB511288]|nr:hypothetical protein SD81_013925 [Tolypothrix campylonemoides VB511288]
MKFFYRPKVDVGVLLLFQRVAPRSPQPDSRIPWGGMPLGALGTGNWEDVLTGFGRGLNPRP